MSTNTKIKLIENSILAVAAGRKSGCAFPLPDGLETASPKPTALLKRLLKAGMLEEYPTRSATLSWRSDEAGKNFLLRITKAGREAAEQAAEPAPDQSVASQIAEAEGVQNGLQGPGGKLGQVRSAVMNERGASLADLISLTGWQAHTVRASLSRLRQTGLAIDLVGVEGAKRYQASLDQQAA